MRYLFCLVIVVLLISFGAVPRHEHISGAPSAMEAPGERPANVNDGTSAATQGAQVTQIDLVRASQVMDLPQRLEILEGFLKRPMKEDLRAVTFRMIVVTCKELNDVEAATFYGEEALIANPTDGPVLIELTEVYATTDESDADRGILYAGRAMEALKSAAEAMGEDGEKKLGVFFGAVQRDWGWLEFRRGNVDNAERLLVEALKKRKEPETYLRLGLVRKSTGRVDQAKDDLAMALALSSGKNKGARDAIQEIITAEGGGDADIEAIVKEKRAKITQQKKTAMAEQSRLKPEPAPAFTVDTLDGRTVSLDDLRGSVVVMDFWATWCGPCRLELPLVQRTYEEFRDERVAFLAVSTDADTSLVRPYLKKNNITLPAACGRSVARAYGVGSIPVLVVIDGTGQLRYMHTGYHPDLEEVLPEEIREVLGEL